MECKNEPNRFSSQLSSGKTVCTRGSRRRKPPSVLGQRTQRESYIKFISDEQAFSDAAREIEVLAFIPAPIAGIRFRERPVVAADSLRDPSVDECHKQWEARKVR